MGFQKRLQKLGVVVGALQVLAAAIVALYPVPFAHALKAAQPEINYDDPNMATTDGYVAEASITCIKQGADGTDVHSCMRGFSKNSENSEPVAVAQKKDEAQAPSSSSSSSSSDTSSKD